MRRGWILFVVGAISLMAGSAFGQTDTTITTPGSQQPGTPQTPPSGAPMTTPPAVSETPAATPAMDPGYIAMRDKAKAATGSQVSGINKNLVTISKQVDDQAAKDGDQVVATRLAADFSTNGDSLVAEKSRYGTGWGDLMIAHTLASNSTTPVTMNQIFQMRGEGIGWGEISSGLDLKLGSVVSAARSESHVALGTSKPDGKPAKIAVASAEHAQKEADKQAKEAAKNAEKQAKEAEKQAKDAADDAAKGKSGK